MLNKEIHEALEEICAIKGLSENTKKQIAAYLDVLSVGTEKKSDQDTRLANILEGIINGS